MRSVKDITEEAFRLHKEGRYSEALKIYDKMLGMLDQPDPNILMGYGLMLAQDGYDGIAKHLMMQAIDCHTEPYAPLWFNLGVSLSRLDRDEAAKSAFEQAIEIDPEFPDALSGMAGRYINNGTPEIAEQWARKALAKDPEFPPAHNDLALALFEQGRFQEAWEHWAYRWKLTINVRNVRPYTCPKWKGEHVGTLAIHGEQGLGDEILYMAAWSRLNGRADRIVIECAPRLVPLFERSFNVPCYPDHASLIENEGEPDRHIAMGDLWSIVGLPGGQPFLWTEERPIAKRPLVGIAWKGGMQRTHKKHRTMKLEQLRPILDIKGIDFINLQYGGAEIDAEAKAAGLATPPDRSFDELVAWVASCDLVITSCQTNVHIAGGLGKPCWVATPHACAWRYSGTTEQMRFYESVRLYRQNEDCDWFPVIHSIAADLQANYG